MSHHVAKIRWCQPAAGRGNLIGAARYAYFLRTSRKFCPRFSMGANIEGVVWHCLVSHPVLQRRQMKW
jgi:hypothetical protein